MASVEETRAKSSLDVRIPGAALLSSRPGVVQLLLPLPAATTRRMEEWERVLLGHHRSARCRAALVSCNLLLP